MLDDNFDFLKVKPIPKKKKNSLFLLINYPDNPTLLIKLVKKILTLLIFYIKLKPN